MYTYPFRKIRDRTNTNTHTFLEIYIYKNEWKSHCHQLSVCFRWNNSIWTTISNSYQKSFRLQTNEKPRIVYFSSLLVRHLCHVCRMILVFLPQVWKTYLIKVNHYLSCVTFFITRSWIKIGIKLTSYIHTCIKYGAVSTLVFNCPVCHITVLASLDAHLQPLRQLAQLHSHSFNQSWSTMFHSNHRWAQTNNTNPKKKNEWYKTTNLLHTQEYINTAVT